MTKRKGGLISEHSKWIGRWGVYWRIQKWQTSPIIYKLAMQFAEKYPQTWEPRLIIYWDRVRTRRHKEFQDLLGITED